MDEPVKKGRKDALSNFKSKFVRMLYEDVEFLTAVMHIIDVRREFEEDTGSGNPYREVSRKWQPQLPEEYK